VSADNKNTPAKRGRGRPKSKLSESDLEILREGGTQTELAKRIGINRRTLRKQIKENKDVAESYEIGRDVQLERVEATLIAQATDKANPRSVAASQLLYRLRGKLDGDGTTNVNVNIPLPQPISGNQFMKAMKNITPNAPPPVALEHAPDNRESMTFAEMLGARK
jgi:hypothetical protein